MEDQEVVEKMAAVYKLRDSVSRYLGRTHTSFQPDTVLIVN